MLLADGTEQNGAECRAVGGSVDTRACVPAADAPLRSTTAEELAAERRRHSRFFEVLRVSTLRDWIASDGCRPIAARNRTQDRTVAGDIDQVVEWFRS